ncbi:hypothetical protein [Mesorhizobium sp. M0768]|uniref:hypothetical protein n=1 Tax=Mesorhizobium sp. M0768 TaxID=2956996 RepID=UPI003339AC00
MSSTAGDLSEDFDANRTTQLDDEGSADGARRHAAVQVAALSLSKPGIGLVVVCDDNGAAAGVLSKSDLIRHLTGAGSPTPPAAQCMDFRRVQSGMVGLGY